MLLFAGALQYRNLSNYYQTLQPVPGGIYHEGIIGNFTNANPIFAAGEANNAVSRLVFSGLFKYDNSNNLVGDLAKDWTLDSAEDSYTVNLKAGIVWHDGQPFTADDVIFTYKTIQNGEAQSTSFSSWKDIKISKSGSHSVVFDLPNALSSFPHSLTNGIIPAHLLKDIPPFQLRSAAFNTSPVGTGPFEWKFVEAINRGTQEQQQRISLAAFEDYWVGRPKLDGFSLTTFTDEVHLVQAFKNKQINAMSGLQSVPEELAAGSGLEVYATPLTSIVMAFFNTSKPNLDNAEVRRSLVAAVNTKLLQGLLEYPTRLVKSPLLPGQLGHDRSILQASFNSAQANKLLDQAGWTRSASGQRVKDGQSLAFNLSAQDTREYTAVAKFLQQQWAQLGVKVTVSYYDAEYLQGVVVANHDYDILLHGISIGVDPDVFAYWDSSQASITSQGHLNLSEYRSEAADQALGSARTRIDQATRATKYKAFLNIWAKDAPALALYQPHYLYISWGQVFDYNRKASNNSSSRFFNVHEWMIRQQKQTIDHQE